MGFEAEKSESRGHSGVISDSGDTRFFSQLGKIVGSVLNMVQGLHELWSVPLGSGTTFQKTQKYHQLFSFPLVIFSEVDQMIQWTFMSPSPT